MKRSILVILIFLADFAFCDTRLQISINYLASSQWHTNEVPYFFNDSSFIKFNSDSTISFGVGPHDSPIYVMEKWEIINGNVKIIFRKYDDSDSYVSEYALYRSDNSLYSIEYLKQIPEPIGRSRNSFHCSLYWNRASRTPTNSIREFDGVTIQIENEKGLISDNVFMRSKPNIITGNRYYYRNDDNGEKIFFLKMVHEKYFEYMGYRSICEVTIVGKKTTRDTIQGKTNYWYLIIVPPQFSENEGPILHLEGYDDLGWWKLYNYGGSILGWVFGEYLEITN